MFVGGVHPDCDDEEFKEFFEQFGPVSDATIMHDRNTGRPRGFGFVTFRSWDSVQKALDAQATRGVLIRGKRVSLIFVFVLIVLGGSQASVTSKSTPTSGWICRWIRRRYAWLW